MKVNYLIIVLMIAACLLGVGCQPVAVRPGDRVLCPGKSSIEEAIKILSLQRNNAQSFQARADCVFHYQDKNGKEKPESVPSMTVRFVPPDQILFRGSKFGEVGFGANEKEFWLRIKPEFDKYWWGTRDQVARCDETILINPYNVIEAFGIVEITTDWQLSHEHGFDILTLFDDEGTLVKRIYVNACDYLTERIEYYDKEGFLAASADLSDYTVAEGIVVPSKVEATSYRYGIKENLVEIKLKHVQSFAPTEEQRRLLFKRPERDGYEHMYRLGDNCEFIEDETNAELDSSR